MRVSARKTPPVPLLPRAGRLRTPRHYTLHLGCSKCSSVVQHGQGQPHGPPWHPCNSARMHADSRASKHSMHPVHLPPCRGTQRTQGPRMFTLPEPETKTLLPRVTPALLQAWIPTERGSIRAPSSKVTLSGSLQEPDTRSSHQ